MMKNSSVEVIQITNLPVFYCYKSLLFLHLLILFSVSTVSFGFGLFIGTRSTAHAWLSCLCPCVFIVAQEHSNRKDCHPLSGTEPVI